MTLFCGKICGKFSKNVLKNKLKQLLKIAKKYIIELLWRKMKKKLLNYEI